jgi:hypothetical protein
MPGQKDGRSGQTCRDTRPEDEGENATWMVLTWQKVKRLDAFVHILSTTDMQKGLG